MIGWLPSAFGRMLRGKRVGIDKTLYFSAQMASVPATITVASSAFKDGEAMPHIYSCDGDNQSPPLSWSGIPANAASVVLVVEDADSPTPSPMVHLVVWGFSGNDGSLSSGACNRKRKVQDSGQVNLGRNGMFTLGYTPPDPPPGHGPHRYLFQVYALDQRIEFAAAPKLRQLASSIQGHVVAKGVIEGRYERE